MITTLTTIFAVVLFVIVWAFCNLLQKKESEIEKLKGAIINMGFVPLDSYLDEDHDVPQPFNPKRLTEKGWTRGWGEAAVMNPYFEILQKVRKFQRKDESEVVYHEYLLVCPSMLDKPIYIVAEKPFTLSY